MEGWSDVGRFYDNKKRCMKECWISSPIDIRDHIRSRLVRHTKAHTEWVKNYKITSQFIKYTITKDWSKKFKEKDRTSRTKTTPFSQPMERQKGSCGGAPGMETSARDEYVIFPGYYHRARATQRTGLNEAKIMLKPLAINESIISSCSLCIITCLEGSDTQKRATVMVVWMWTLLSELLFFFSFF